MMLRAAIAVAALWAMPAAAADLVSARDIPSVVGALSAAGVPIAIEHDEDGGIYLVGGDDGDEFTVDFDDCDDDAARTGCKLLNFEASWEPETFIDAALVNRFNRDATLGHAYLDDDGALHLVLSVTTVAGLPPENFRDVLAWWRDADARLGELIDAANPAPTAPDGGAIPVTAQ